MPAIISGIVFNDLNSNGTFNVGDPGIENVFVVLVDTLGNCTSTQTDATGSYSFTGISTAGAYTVFETVADPGATCPPTVFTQPTGFTESTTPRQINRTVSAANISGNVNLSGNNYGHDNIANTGCGSFAYQVQGSPTNFTRIDLVTGDTVGLGALSPSSTFFGTGYNVVDGNFWGYNSTTSRVGRISGNRTVTDLPAVPNLPVVGFNVGDVNADGYLYLYSSSTATFFIIDVNSNRGTYGRLVDPANSFEEQTVAPFGVSISSAINISDWAFNPQDGNLYAVGNNSGAAARINPIDGTVTPLTTTPAVAGTYGASFFDNHNNLYEIENTNGNIFRYALGATTATRTLFSNSVAASTNDGARCATAPLAFAQFTSTKTATPYVGVGQTITYTIVLNNIGNESAINVVLLDTIPNGTSFLSNSVTFNRVTIPGDPTPPTGVQLGTLPVGVTTITFQVSPTTVPSPNPVPNTAFGTFNFTDTGDTFTSTFSTNIATTTINFASIDSTKGGNKVFAGIGDTITYTVTFKNIGNTTVTRIIFIDTIPNDTTFVASSLRQDGVLVSGSPNPPGITLPNAILAGRSSTVTFQVRVTTIPNPNPIPNIASGTFFYTGNPSFPSALSGGTNTNQFDVLVNFANLAGIQKFVDRAFATCGDTIVYTIVVPNSGNVTALNVVVKDTIPNGTTQIPNTVTVDGILQAGVNMLSGVTIPTVAAGDASTITFQVKVSCLGQPT